jgi:small subunit ribosomal protein S8
MSVDTIGDFLTALRNGVQASKPFIVVSYSRLKSEIAQILKDEGFIRDFAVEGDGASKKLKVFLKYSGGESVIHEIRRISRPGRRSYTGYKAFSPVIGGLGLAIMTTNRGIMTDKKARQLAVGGEVICTVW